MQNSSAGIESNLVKATAVVQKTKWLKFLKAVPFYKVIFQEVFLASFLYLPIRKCVADVKKVQFSNLDELIEFSFKESEGLINPAQIRSEIKSLLSILQKSNVKTFMEIGTAKGGTLFLFFKVASKDASGISLDL
ncbi:hypothetical protein FJZ26_05905, partial [Candidatus Parvarchaeota archaeon]|nr:hypothetical protein [Candidatus Parvarchaeota archaeon]